jgi:hypothetical protein
LYENKTVDEEEIHSMRPGATTGAVLVEEFVDSISLGQALIEEKVDINIVAERICDTLSSMHVFAAHHDLKHAHLRIRLSKEAVEDLQKGMKPTNNLDVFGVTVIDVETAKFFMELDQEQIKDYISMDITQLIISLSCYLSVLEADSPLVRKYFPMSFATRLKRLEILLETMSQKYDIKVQFRFMPVSKTVNFLKSWLE